MAIRDIDLLPAEYEALLEMIRRDYRAESFKSQHAATERDWHGGNARMCIRLLELLNPKRQVVQAHLTASLSLYSEPGLVKVSFEYSKLVL